MVDYVNILRFALSVTLGGNFLAFPKERVLKLSLSYSLLRMFLDDWCSTERSFMVEKFLENQENTSGISITLLNILF